MAPNYSYSNKHHVDKISLLLPVYVLGSKLAVTAFSSKAYVNYSEAFGRNSWLFLTE